MIVFRLSLAFLGATLLAGCVSDSGVPGKAISKSSSSSECQAPGTAQPMFCNYRLVVRNITGNLFQGYVDPKLVSEGEESCRKLVTKVRMPDNVKCREAKSYTFYLYQFEIEGDRPNDGEVVELVNIPFTNKLKKGHILTDETSNDSYVPVFETMHRESK